MWDGPGGDEVYLNAQKALRRARAEERRQGPPSRRERIGFILGVLATLVLVALLIALLQSNPT